LAAILDIQDGSHSIIIYYIPWYYL